ncbi:hypothetical protein GCM10028895_06430 [Pontibacter rugosus]
MEVKTALQIVNFIKRYQPDEIHTQVGGTGVAAIFYGKKIDGPTILFRAELDALPIEETNENLPHKSVMPGIGHKCGHDGHMAILAALGSLLHQDKHERGKVILLFQPAEETELAQGMYCKTSDFSNSTLIMFLPYTTYRELLCIKLS